VGNHRLYPAADRLQLRLRYAPPALPAAAHRQRWADSDPGATNRRQIGADGAPYRSKVLMIYNQQ
jgi:hypothetical protein